ISSTRPPTTQPTYTTLFRTTDEPADAQVEYGQTAGYGSSSPVNGAFLFSHSQPLTGLSNGTLYHYRVKSKDVAGNLSVSSDATFTTLTPPDTTPPLNSPIIS